MIDITMVVVYNYSKDFTGALYTWLNLKYLANSTHLVKANSCRLKGLLCGQITQTQAATTIIERLFKNGWIERERSNQDRRIVWLKLTLQGEKLLSDIEVKRLQLLMQQFEHITEEKLEIACQLMKKALAGADN